MVATKERTAKVNEIQSLIQSHYSIFMCDGDKGGVGKSFFARALFHYLQSKKIPIIGVEGDRTTPDFKTIVGGDIKVIEFVEDDSRIDSPNLLFELLEEQKHSVVNLRGSCHGAFVKWIETYDILTVLRQCDARMIKFFVVSGEFDSLKSLQISLSKFGRTIPHVVVKNMKYPDWDYYEEHTEIQSLIKTLKCPVIELPKMPTRIASFQLQKRLSLAASLTYKGDKSKGERFSMVERTTVSKFIKDFAAQVDTVWGQLP